MTDQAFPDTRASGAYGCNTAEWLLLSCLPKFGRRLRRDLSTAYPNLTDVLALNPATLKALGLPTETTAAIQAWQGGDRQHPVTAKVATIQQDCERLGIAVIASSDPLFPDPLRHIHDAPLVLYTQATRACSARTRLGWLAAAMPPGPGWIMPAPSPQNLVAAIC